MSQSAASAPTTLVVFGVSGDLAARKLLPALYWLLEVGKLPNNFHIIGAARREVTVEGLIAKTREYVGPAARDEVLDRLGELITVIRMDSGDQNDYTKLLEVLEGIEAHAEAATRLLYLSVPPKVDEAVIRAFQAVGLNQVPGVTTRLLMEKPFGSDLASAEELDRHLHGVFQPEQIYRIDHYVAKETVQNIEVLRTHNRLLQMLWDREHVERIEIEASQPIGIEGRVDFYEQTGALRDLVQSHLLALTALIMMEPPVDESAAAVHQARTSLIEAIAPLGPHSSKVVRGQYEGYRQEVGNPDSFVETFVRLELTVDNQRWRGVPVILQTGKSLAAERTEVRVIFKACDGQMPNQLHFVLAPADSVELQLIAKQPGLTRQTTPIQLGYTPRVDASGRQQGSYERVITEAIAGDQTNFTGAAEVLATWRLIEPVLQAWQHSGEGLQFYAQGSDGPADSHF